MNNSILASVELPTCDDSIEHSSWLVDELKNYNQTNEKSFKKFIDTKMLLCDFGYHLVDAECMRNPESFNLTVTGRFTEVKLTIIFKLKTLSSHGRVKLYLRIFPFNFSGKLHVSELNIAARSPSISNEARQLIFHIFCSSRWKFFNCLC